MSKAVARGGSNLIDDLTVEPVVEVVVPVVVISASSLKHIK